MPRRQLRGIREMQVGDPLIRVVSLPPPQVGARHERDRAAHDELRLENVGRVVFSRSRRASVDEEHRHGTSALGELPVKLLGSEGAREDRKAQPAAFRNRPIDRLFAQGREVDLDRLLPRPALPHVEFLFLLVARRQRLHGVVAPAHDHLQAVRLRCHEKAHPHGRGEEALPGGLAVGGVLLHGSTLIDLLEILVGVVVSPRVAFGVDRNQETGQVPVGRPVSPVQEFLGQLVPGPRPHQVQAQAIDQALARFQGVSGRAALD